MTQGAISQGLGRSKAGAGLACVAGVALVATALLVGCAREPSPPPSTPPSVAPTTAPVTPDPESDDDVPAAPPEAPVLPAEMEDQGEAGALAAAVYFMELYAYVFATGDLAEWDRISGQTCSFCANTRDAVSSTLADGGSFTGGAMLALDDAEIVGFDEQLVVWGVQVRYDRDAGTRVEADGAVHELAAESGYVVLDVAPSVRGWLLMGGQAQDGPVT